MRNVADKLNDNPAKGNWYVCSVIVQARPEKLDQIKAVIATLPYTEIHGEKPEEGKLVVVMESDYQRALVERMEYLRDIDGVIVVSLIYSQLDEQD